MSTIGSAIADGSEIRTSSKTEPTRDVSSIWAAELLSTSCGAARASGADDPRRAASPAVEIGGSGGTGRSGGGIAAEPELVAAR